MSRSSRSNGSINVAVVGLGFGEDFLPIYLDHPEVGEVGIVDISKDRLERAIDLFGLEHTYEHYDDMLADSRWDAVHILAPVAFHGSYSAAALQAGKHCACAVPMATSIGDIEAIVDAQRQSNKRYMMMETSVYARAFSAVRRLYENGELGTITMYRGVHIQNLDGYPEYWRGFPPMHYLTHALSPALALTGDTVAEVAAYGSGTLTPDRDGGYENPFPTEVGLFRMANSSLTAEITMSFFQTARPYMEGFSVYGEDMSVEWPDTEGSPLRTYRLLPLDPDQPDRGLRGRRCRAEHLMPEDEAGSLPDGLVQYLREFEVKPARGGQVMRRTAEHGGSHPHLVHEFISSVVEDRPSAIDTETAAAWTVPGICAHQSALRGGERVSVPPYGRATHSEMPRQR